jgi:DNA gyrase subunit A
MRLQRLTGLEQDKIIAEYKDVMARSTTCWTSWRGRARLDHHRRRTDRAAHRIRPDQSRRAPLHHRAQCAGPGHRGPDHAHRHGGHAQPHRLHQERSPVRIPRAKARRARQAGHATKEDDWIDQLFIANTHDYILCFSNRGRVYWLKVWECPRARAARAAAHRQHVPAAEGEKINVVLPLTGENRSFPDNRYVFMATSMGTVKKTALTEFSNPRKAGIIAVDLDEGDYLIGAALTDGAHDVMLFSDGGKAVRFDENDVRPMGRARGVRGMSLEDGQSVIAMLVAEGEAPTRPAPTPVPACSPPPKTVTESAPTLPNTRGTAAAPRA